MLQKVCMMWHITKIMFKRDMQCVIVWLLWNEMYESFTSLIIIRYFSKLVTNETNAYESDFTYHDSATLEISCICNRRCRILVPEVSWIDLWRDRPRQELRVGRGKGDQTFGHYEVSFRRVDCCVTFDEGGLAPTYPTKSVVIASFDRQPNK